MAKSGCGDEDVEISLLITVICDREVLSLSDPMITAKMGRV